MRRPLFHLPLALFLSGLPAFVLPAKEEAPLATVLQSCVDHHIIAGAVALVADKDKVLDLESVGWSSLKTRTPMQTDGVFWIASMSKSITATAFMMLVDEGKASLDDPVSKYIPQMGQL